MTDEFDDLVGAIAKNDILSRYAEAFRNRPAQLVAASIRVEMGALQRPSHRLKSLGRGAERIFIGGELDDLILL